MDQMKGGFLLIKRKGTGVEAISDERWISSLLLFITPQNRIYIGLVM